MIKFNVPEIYRKIWTQQGFNFFKKIKNKNKPFFQMRWKFSKICWRSLLCRVNKDTRYSGSFIELSCKLRFVLFII